VESFGVTGVPEGLLAGVIVGCTVMGAIGRNDGIWVTGALEGLWKGAGSLGVLVFGWDFILNKSAVLKK